MLKIEEPHPVAAFTEDCADPGSAVFPQLGSLEVPAGCIHGFRANTGMAVELRLDIHPHRLQPLLLTKNRSRIGLHSGPARLDDINRHEFGQDDRRAKLYASHKKHFLRRSKKIRRGDDERG